MKPIPLLFAAAAVMTTITACSSSPFFVARNPMPEETKAIAGLFRKDDEAASFPAPAAVDEAPRVREDYSSPYFGRGTYRGSGESAEETADADVAMDAAPPSPQAHETPEAATSLERREAETSVVSPSLTLQPRKTTGKLCYQCNGKGFQLITGERALGDKEACAACGGSGRQ